MENKSNTQDIVETDNFICDLCGEKFDAVSDLEQHKLRHGRPGRGLTDTQHEIRGDIGAAGMPTSPVQ
jgi:hypothetical protein